jgi:hypothetical protein
MPTRPGENAPGGRRGLPSCEQAGNLGALGAAGEWGTAVRITGLALGRRFILGGAPLVLLVAAAGQAEAAKSCVFGWAVPGTYVISGNFRGSVESTTARLTPDCKVSIRIPGVFTGGPVTRSGQCLRFSFKVQGEKRVFTAQWCNGYGIVPWQGRNIRATVTRKQAEPEVETRYNFKGSTD